MTNEKGSKLIVLSIYLTKLFFTFYMVELLTVWKAVFSCFATIGTCYFLLKKKKHYLVSITDYTYNISKALHFYAYPKIAISYLKIDNLLFSYNANVTNTRHKSATTGTFTAYSVSPTFLEFF